MYSTYSEKVVVSAMNYCCPFCGCSQFIRSIEASNFDDGENNYSIIVCNNCNIALTIPELSNSELTKYYQSNYYGQPNKKFIPLFEYFTEMNNQHRANKILIRFYEKHEQQSGPLRILDIGCGRAGLLKELAKMGHQCYGVERTEFFNPDQNNDLRIYTDELENVNFPNKYFDIVILWHSLEHMQNPNQLLDEIVRILKKKGFIVIAAPNFESVQFALFKRYWFHLDLPRHCYHFGLDSLIKHLESKGIEIEETSTFSFEQNPFGFIQSSLNWLIRSSKPNRLYSLIKAGESSRSKVEIAFWFFLIVLLFPFALIEYIVSGLLHKGAVFTIFGMKIS